LPGDLPRLHIATRYEKRGANFLGMVTLGKILLWL